MPSSTARTATAVDERNILRELLRAVTRSMGTIEEHQLQCCGITLPQCSAILELGLAGALSVVELAARLGVDKSTMSRTVDSLVNMGLASREQDTENRRYVKVTLTSNGKAVFTRTDEVYFRYLDEVLAAIPEEPRSQVMESMIMLTTALSTTRCC